MLTLVPLGIGNALGCSGAYRHCQTQGNNDFAAAGRITLPARFVPGDECFDAVFYGRRWFVIQQVLGFGDVVAGLWHVTRLERQAVQNGFLTHALLYQADQTIKSDGIRFAEIDDFEAEITVYSGQAALDDVALTASSSRLRDLCCEIGSSFSASPDP